MEHLKVYADMYSYKEFPRLCNAIFRKLAKDLSLEKGTYDIRNGGKHTWICEMVFHHEHFYLVLSPSNITGCAGFDRSCNGRKDYVGGCNQWFEYSYDELKVITERLLWQYK